MLIVRQLTRSLVLRLPLDPMYGFLGHMDAKLVDARWLDTGEENLMVL